MIQLWVDNKLMYDSRLTEDSLLELSYTKGLNRSGTAVFTMPPNHGGYDAIVSYRSLVEIYKDDNLEFRGRVLFPADDFYRCRTVTCEGERGFFQDATMRPYLFQGSPESIFRLVLASYNSQVDEFKQFALGDVTVTDANEYIRLESTKAEQVSDTIDKLVERCGGYIVFTTDKTGQREVNWLAELDHRNGQTIEFGKNLLDFAQSDGEDELATVIIPYGAKVETEGSDAEKRVTITEVNNGLDYIVDEEAAAYRGYISKPVYWDDVSEPGNLLRKAKEYLAHSRNVVTTLTLTAVDLSNLDKNIDIFEVGDLIRVRSKPHGVDDYFTLSEKTVNLLDPSDDTVVLGKERTTLTGLDVAGDRKSSSEMSQMEYSLRADYNLNISGVKEEFDASLKGLEASQAKTNASVVKLSGDTRISLAQLAAAVECITSRQGESVKSIDSNANMNELTDVGVYACHNNSIAKTLYNRPTDLAFTMQVYSATGEEAVDGVYRYVIQEIRVYLATEPTYRRTCTRNDKGMWSFGDWAKETVSTATTFNSL